MKGISHIKLRSFTLNEPTGGFVRTIEAISERNPKGNKRQFVIICWDCVSNSRSSWDCHFYKSESALRKAFNEGLRVELAPVAPEADFATESGLAALIAEVFKPSPFANRAGFIRTVHCAQREELPLWVPKKWQPI